MTTSVSEGQSSALAQVAGEVPHYSAYRPLDPAKREIRLLTILDEHLNCSIEHASLDSGPQYTSLSYYWGAPGVTKPIVLSGERLHIRKTLYQFLKSLFRHAGAITVWLDLLCIDQKNVTEQSSQVAMMGEIYTNASCVYSWLGKGDADTDFALRSLRKTDDRSLYSNHEKHVRAGLQTLSVQQYWTRVWIVQECQLNTTVTLLCGSETADFDKFLAACLQPSMVSKELFVHNSSLETGRSRSNILDGPASNRLQEFQRGRARSTRNKELLLLDLVSRFDQHECKDRKDKIYGFRALALNGKQLQVDYHKDIVDIVLEVLSAHNWSCFLLQCDQHTRRLVDSEPVTGRKRRNWWTIDGDGRKGIFNGAEFICRALQVKSDEIFRRLKTDHDEWLVIPVASLQWRSQLQKGVTFWMEHAQEGTPQKDFMVMWGELQNLDSLLYHTLGCGSEQGMGIEDSEIFIEVEADSGNLLSAKVNMAAIHIVEDTIGRNPPDGEVVRYPDYMVDLVKKHLSQQRIFQAIWRGNIWLCRVTQGIHISRFLLFLLTALATSRNAAIQSEFLEYAQQQEPSQTPECTCVISKGLQSAFPPPWGASKLRIPTTLH